MWTTSELATDEHGQISLREAPLKNPPVIDSVALLVFVSQSAGAMHFLYDPAGHEVVEDIRVGLT